MLFKCKLIHTGRKYTKTAVVSLRIIGEDFSAHMVLVHICWGCKLSLKVFLIALVYNNNVLKILDDMR